MLEPSNTHRMTERRECTAIGLAATFTGTTNTEVLLFAAEPTFALGTVNRGIAGAGFIENQNAEGVAISQGAWFNWQNSATLGTIISLLERGWYYLALDGIQTAAAALIWAISFNGDFTGAVAGQLSTVAGVEASTGLMTTVAADTAPVNLRAYVYVSDAQAGTERVAVQTSVAAIEAQTNVNNHATVRFCCSQAAGGPPLDAEILQAQIRVRIAHLGDKRAA